MQKNGTILLRFGNWLRSQFPYKVQKISVNAGFTCPNRDGRIGRGGCFYCNNQTFNPAYCDNGKSVTQQLEDGKRFFSGKYPEMKYLAYFQAYTNTYGTNDHIKKLYEEALAVEDVVGLVIGTRPDCINDDLLDYFEELNRRTFLIVVVWLWKPAMMRHYDWLIAGMTLLVHVKL